MSSKPAPSFVYSERFFNNQVGALEMGFISGAYNNTAYIKVSNVLEEVKGKKAKKGQTMFDYDKSLIFNLSTPELIILKKGLDMIDDGEIESIDPLEHKYGESIKKLTIGKKLDGESENIQIYVEELERDDPESEPINSTWFEFGSERKLSKKITINAEIEVFKKWLEYALAYSLNVVNSAVCNSFKSSGNYGNNRDDRDDERRPSSKKSRRRDDDEEGDDREDDEDAPPKGGSSRRRKGGSNGVF
jgi:hypothetical protein